MIVELLHPAPSRSVDLADRDSLRELYRPPLLPWLRINMVASVSGSVAGSDGTSETLTSAADRRILGVIRELAEVVIVGAESVRAEGYLQPKRARLAIVTQSGDLSGHRVVPAHPQTPLVLCPATAVSRVAATMPVAEIIVVPVELDGRLSPTSIVATLRVHGYNSLVCEGGPRLVSQFVDAGLVDEICLTTSPRCGGNMLPMLGTQPIAERNLGLTLLLRDDYSTLYARWRVLPASGANSADGDH